MLTGATIKLYCYNTGLYVGNPPFPWTEVDHARVFSREQVDKYLDIMKLHGFRYREVLVDPENSEPRVASRRI